MAAHLSSRYRLRLIYNRTVPDDLADAVAEARESGNAVSIAGGHEVAVAEIADLDAVQHSVAGCDAILHLAAVPSVHAPWDAVLHANIVGTYNIYEGALRAGVPRVVFASSNHATGFYERDGLPVGPDMPVRPDGYYGVSKAFGEALCRLYAHKYHMAVTVLRIGHVVHDIVDAAPGQGIAAEDMNRIFLLALSFRTPGYRLFHAVAPHEGYPLSDGRLTREGFLFRQQGPGRAEIIARLERSPRLNAVARDHHGGDFVQYD
jgi:hypothetical protein